MHNKNSGNALFIVLIGITLFAALSYAVAISGRSYSSDVTTEQLNLGATEFIQYAEAMATAVTQMRLRGVKNTNLCFDEAKYGHALYNFAACSTASNKVYDPSGGNLTWAQPELRWFADQDATRHWDISGNVAVSGIGTTCASASCADLVVRMDDLTKDICVRINERLGVTNTSGNPPTDSGAAWARFIGTYGYAATIGDEASGVNFKDKNAACFSPGPGSYSFYRVLEVR